MNEARQGPPRRDSPCAVFPLLRIREAAARGVCEINSCAGRLGLGWGMAYEALHRQPKGTDRLSPRCVPQRITPPAIAQQPMLNLASASATADHQAPVISRSRTHTAKRAQPKRGTAAGRGTNKRTGRGRGGQGDGTGVCSAASIGADSLRWDSRCVSKARRVPGNQIRNVASRRAWRDGRVETATAAGLSPILGDA